MIDALRTAAAPALRAWIDANVRDVLAAVRRATDRAVPSTTIRDLVEEQFTHEPSPIEAIIAGAARAPTVELSPERRAALRSERDDLMGKRRKSYDEGARLRAINVELAGNIDQKEAVRWLKARARKLAGSFDPDVVVGAFRFLPGWRIEETVTFYPVTYTTSDAVSRWITALDGRGISHFDVGPSNQGPRWFDVRVNSWRDPATRAMVPADIAGLARLVDRVRVVGADTKGKPTLPATADTGTLYTAQMQRGESGIALSLRGIVLGVRGWTFTAPDGASFTLPEKPHDAHDAIDGGAVYRWAYEHGLNAQAEAAIPTAEAAVPLARTGGAEDWSRNLCQVCFRAHALTPLRGVLVDHGHRRPGWGYNVQPCRGSGVVSYAASATTTALEAEVMVRTLHNLHADYAVLAAGGADVVFDVKVYTRTPDGWKVRETDEARRRRYGEWRTHDERVDRTHPLWATVRQTQMQQIARSIRGLQSTIPFFRSAVRQWGPWAQDTPVTDVYRRILHGIDAVDKEGLGGALAAPGRA
jgi:hypothetical protein